MSCLVVAVKSAKIAKKKIAATVTAGSSQEGARKTRWQGGNGNGWLPVGGVSGSGSRCEVRGAVDVDGRRQTSRERIGYGAVKLSQAHSLQGAKKLKLETDTAPPGKQNKCQWSLWKDHRCVLQSGPVMDGPFTQLLMEDIPVTEYEGAFCVAPASCCFGIAACPELPNMAWSSGRWAWSAPISCFIRAIVLLFCFYSGWFETCLPNYLKLPS